MNALQLRKLLLLFIVSTLLKSLFGQHVVSSRDDSHSESNNVANQSVSISTKKPSDDLIEKWEKIDQTIKQVVSRGIKSLLPIVTERYGTMNVSAACTRNIIKFLAGLKQSKVWAFRIIDASGKGLDGILSGSLAAIGDYDQCVNTEVPNERRGSHYGEVLFTGKYCAVDLRPPLPRRKAFYKIDEVLEELKNFSKKGTLAAEMAKSAHFFYMLALRIGLCVPSGCSKEDISNILQGHHTDFIRMKEVVRSANETLVIDVVYERRIKRSNTIVPEGTIDIEVKRCEVKDEKKVTPIMIVVWTIYGFLVLLMIIGTTVDVVYYYKKQKIQGTGLKMLTSFSFVTNFKKLVNTSSSSEKLGCLSGIKALSIIWIILGHTYLNINYQLFRGFRRVTTYQKDFAFQAVINAAIAVDTFFFIGGLLVCYVTVKLVKEMKKKFSVVFYVIHRLWRLLPLYMGVILLALSLTIVSSGPIWHDTVDTYFDQCYGNWWSNLIFLNNYLHPKSMCMTHSWYIACDMQLYLFSLIILLPLLRWPKVGIALTIFFTIVSIVTTSLIVHLNKLPPTMLYVHPDPDQRLDYWGVTYFKPYPHAGPYFIGILVGYLLVTKPNIHFSRKMQILGWCAAIICNMSVLYGVWGWNRGIEPTMWETILYSGCHRTAWALGVAWIVICCATGQGGIIHYILTWKAWIPIGRLTYAAYLIHPVVQIGILGSVRIKLQPSHDFAIWMYFGHLMTTYGASFGLSMLIEAPCLALEKILLQKRESTKDVTNKNRCIGQPVFEGARLKKPVANDETNVHHSENSRMKKPVANDETNVHDSVRNNHICRL